MKELPKSQKCTFLSIKSWHPFNCGNSVAQGLAFIAVNASNLIVTREIYLSHGPAYYVDVEINDPQSEGEIQYLKISIIFKKYASYR